MEKYHILVVEDEKEIANAIEIYLKNQNYEVKKALNGQEALNLMKEHTFHLAIVDIMMPVMDGLQMTMIAKEEYDFPIIFLTAKSQDMDKIMGLNSGADDYITKPFVPMELIARVNSCLRRYQKFLDVKGQQIDNQESITIKGLELNFKTKEVNVDGRNVKVTPIEYKILELLMSNVNQVFSSEQIYELVWKEEAIATETVMVHIRNLREKIEINPKNPQYIKVVWGIGYKIEG
ncbi:MAG: response regulator transcription factor [Erysipelotrichaceae bacterium]